MDAPIEIDGGFIGDAAVEMSQFGQAQSENGMNASAQPEVPYKGNDRLLFGIIMGVIAFWLFAQTTLNIAPDMSRDLGMNASMMNVAVAITSLFSGIFIVVMGGLAATAARPAGIRVHPRRGTPPPWTWTARQQP